MQSFSGRRASKLTFMFICQQQGLAVSSLHWRRSVSLCKAPCYPVFLVVSRQTAKNATPGKGWRKQGPAARASTAEWVECGMLRRNCLCYFNTSECRNSVSDDVLNSAPSVTSAPILPTQTQMPGQRKKTSAASHQHPPSYPGIQITALVRQATWINSCTTEQPAAQPGSAGACQRQANGRRMSRELDFMEWARKQT